MKRRIDLRDIALEAIKRTTADFDFVAGCEERRGRHEGREATGVRDLAEFVDHLAGRRDLDQLNEEIRLHNLQAIFGIKTAKNVAREKRENCADFAALNAALLHVCRQISESAIDLKIAENLILRSRFYM